ncbi:MAG: TrkH family potassium uptake protein [Clostridia bacterium]|nr:TrkH family potassium uptake protein [Clostridia bacterium]
MNKRIVINLVGKAMVLEGIFMLLPMLVGVIYKENTYLSFLLPTTALLLIGIPLSMIKSKDRQFYTKEGLVTVSLVWIVMSLFGALPFVIDGVIPNYIDALFETVSGFTTTGASIMQNVEIMSKSHMFWRVFTHFIGGMGVIVFVLAVLPSDTGAMHIFRAEAPGPEATKLVSKIRYTARILYLIYVVLTIVEIILLLFSGMGFYDAVLNSFSTAGTGGFSRYNNSIAHYNSVYVEMVIAVFMFLFGINFNIFYLILIGNFSKAFRSEELRAYFIIVISAVILIALNILSTCENFWQALRYSFFQTTSIISTTGAMSTDFDAWPTFSKVILLFLMVCGGCGGSTGGGLKISRIVMLVKGVFCDVKRIFYPRAIVTPRFEGKPLIKEQENSVKAYFLIWAIILVLSTLLLSLDGFVSGQNGMISCISTTISCIGNVGPGFDLVGPTLNYSGYAPYSKILLSLVMLVGRLEIFPMLILFSPKTWKKAC